MAQGKVTINNLNLSQGPTPEIERKALFIGEAATRIEGNVFPVTQQSNLDDLLGDEDTHLYRQVHAARLNGGENWLAYVAIQDDEDWELTLEKAMATVSPELVVMCDPVANSADITRLQQNAEHYRTAYGRRIIILCCTPEIDFEQSWIQYAENTAGIVNGVVADRVCAVPLLHGNDLGVLAGRLCNRATSIADSPMRVATGAVVGLMPSRIDFNEQSLPPGVTAQLDGARLSCVQTYPDYPGVYWGDANLLSAPASDYQVIEHLRPVDKAARAIRLLAIARIANRSLNQTPVSIAANKTYFMRPLREMSQSTVFNGEHFPGDIQPPKDDAVTIVWPTPNRVEIYLKLQPYNSPKEIEANIILDLSQEG